MKKSITGNMYDWDGDMVIMLNETDHLVLWGGNRIESYYFLPKHELLAFGNPL